MFDYKAYLDSQSDRDIAVAVATRIMADNGFFDTQAVTLLDEAGTEVLVQLFPGKPGVHQIFLKMDGHQFVADYQLDRETGIVTFANTEKDNEKELIEPIDFLGEYYPTYFPDGVAGEKIRDWYDAADKKLVFKQ
jgi:hypothetical protein